MTKTQQTSFPYTGHLLKGLVTVQNIFRDNVAVHMLNPYHPVIANYTPQIQEFIRTSDDKAPTFENHRETAGIDFENSRFYKGHIQINHGATPIIFTADDVNILSTRCDGDNNAGAAFEFRGGEGQSVTVIMTRDEIKKTLDASQYGSLKTFNQAAPLSDKIQGETVFLNGKGILRKDFDDVFAQALKQVEDVRAIQARLISQSRKTQTVSVDASTSHDFPKSELGDNGLFTKSNKPNTIKRRRSLAVLNGQ